MGKLITILSIILTLYCTPGLAVEGADWYSYDPYAPAITKVITAQVADLASTALAFAVIDNALELNPLGWYLIPVKVAMVASIPFLGEEDQVMVSDISSGLTWGTVANNLILSAGANGSVPIIGGILVASYLLMCDFDVLPSSVCISGGYDE